MADKPTTAPRKRVRKPQRDPTNTMLTLNEAERRAMDAFLASFRREDQA